MVASQKKRPNHSDSSTNTLLLFVGAVMFIAFFLVGLNWGGKTEGKKTAYSSNELHHREDALREQMRECHSKEKNIIESAQFLDESAQSLKDRNKKLDERNKELYEEHSRQETDIAKCQEETETQLTIFTEEDESRKKQIQSLNEELEQLQQALFDLTHGHGMRTVLLSASLERLQASYDRLIQMLNETDTYARLSSEAVLEKHAASLDKAEKISEQRLKSVERTIANWTHWRYDPVNHSDIFLSTIDSDGDVVRPTYLNRTGNPPVRVMRRRRLARTLPATSLATQLVALNDFALCALKHNHPNFTYPNAFYWYYRLESDKSFLSNVVDTPLVVFCEECFNRRKSMEFKLACEEDLAYTYGSYDFWKARALVRFQPSVEHEADNFVFANNLKGKKFLSVVMHSSSDTLEKCEKMFQQSPSPHYLYVLGNFDQQAPPLTKDLDLQCSPTWEQIAERIKAVIKEDSDDVPYDAVYLSVEPESMERVKQEDLPGLHIVMLEQKSAFDEAVDLAVASKANRILVSPYLPQSQVVTELFLMRNQISPNGNIHFF